MELPEYDPDEPLVVRWEDVIAARNAVGSLRSIVKSMGRDQQIMLIAGFGLAAGLPGRRDPSDWLWSQEDSYEWLDDLVGRLTSALPGGVVGHEPYTSEGGSQ